jgi:hypothetical protein
MLLILDSATGIATYSRDNTLKVVSLRHLICRIILAAEESGLPPAEVLSRHHV